MKDNQFHGQPRNKNYTKIVSIFINDKRNKEEETKEYKHNIICKCNDS